MAASQRPNMMAKCALERLTISGSKHRTYRGKFAQTRQVGIILRQWQQQSHSQRRLQTARWRGAVFLLLFGAVAFKYVSAVVVVVAERLYMKSLHSAHMRTPHACTPESKFFRVRLAHGAHGTHNAVRVHLFGLRGAFHPGQMCV